MPVVEFDNVTLGYKNKTIVSNFSGKLACGSYILKGKNGIGKSTTIKSFAGTLTPLKGTVKLNGHDLYGRDVSIKKHLSYLPDKSYAYPFMTGMDFLRMVAHFKKIPFCDELQTKIKELGIEGYLDEKFTNMSLGTQKKFGLAAALFGNPEFILLDEPLNGLDAESKSILHKYLQKMSGLSIVVYSSHDEYLENLLNSKVLEITKNSIVGF